MKRRDVLKSIEVALVVKAYETGHRSQRKDGVYEKQSDGSWQRISGYDKDSHQWKLDKRQRPLTPSEIHELVQIDDIDERRKRQSEMLSQPAPKSPKASEKPANDEFPEQYDELSKDLQDVMFNVARSYKDAWAEDSDPDIRAMADRDVEDIAREIYADADAGEIQEWVETYSDKSSSDDEQEDFDSNEDREFDTLQKSITKMYDTGTLKDDISQIPADSSGSDPDEKEVREFVDGLLAMHDMSRSRLTTDHLDELEDTITDLWRKNKVGKSAVRDMRSIPAIKNMGF